MGDHRYDLMALQYTKECCEVATSALAFINLFNQKVNAYRTSLPVQMKDKWHAQQWHDGKTYVMWKASEQNYRFVYLIEEGGAS